MLWVEMSAMADPLASATPTRQCAPRGTGSTGDGSAWCPLELPPVLTKTPSTPQWEAWAPKPGAAQAPCPSPCQYLLCALQGGHRANDVRLVVGNLSGQEMSKLICPFIWFIRWMARPFNLQFLFMIYFGFVTLLLKTLLLLAHTKLKKIHYKSLSC